MILYTIYVLSSSSTKSLFQINANLQYASSYHVYGMYPENLH